MAHFTGFPRGNKLLWDDKARVGLGKKCFFIGLWPREKKLPFDRLP